MSITTTRLTNGPNGVSWKPIPKTGAAQLVEIREKVQEILVPFMCEAEDAKPRAMQEADFRQADRRRTTRLRRASGMAQGCSRGYRGLLASACRPFARRGCGSLAGDWRPAASLAFLSLRLPVLDPFEHPDAQRRFRLMKNAKESQHALDFPWEKWTVFLHPEQREWVESETIRGLRASPVLRAPARPSWPCTGLLTWRVQNPDARVLLTTFSDTLANALQTKLKRLLGNEPRFAERIDVHSLRCHRPPALQVSRRERPRSPAAKSSSN